MPLCDRQIRALSGSKNKPLISPYNEEQVEPASYDFLLGDTFVRLAPEGPIDIRVETKTETWVVEDDGNDCYLLGPGEFVLARTQEYVNIPMDLVGRMEGKSSLGRLGLQVHSTAGYFDPGFEGVGTLEILNVSGFVWVLRPGMRICQMAFMKMDQMPDRPYQGKYQGQQSTTPSLSHIRE